MKTSPLTRGAALLAGLLGGLGLGAPSPVRAQEAAAVSTRHRFAGLAITAYRDTLVADGAGNFYGVNNTVDVVSNDGTPTDAGQIFKLAADGTVTTLYRFGYPVNGNTYSPLVRGRDGSFYGTAFSGGPAGLGYVYKISPDGVFTDLHDFTGGSDGSQPAAALVQGRDGNFYGTDLGGDNYAGVVFRITPAGEFTVLHEFTGYDGFSPYAPLVQGRDGNFYGTTLGAFGGEALGTAFKITPGGEFTDLHHFGVNDGNSPENALVEGSDGNFYGTTSNGVGSAREGNIKGIGTIFRVTPGGQFITLHVFTGGVDGASPEGLALGADGNLYGTTRQGGLYGRDSVFPRSPGPGYGTIYQLSPGGILTTVYNFTGGADGRNPAGPLQANGTGGFYGTTGGDGTKVLGTLFGVAFSAHPAFFAGQQSIGNGLYVLRFANGNSFGSYGFLSDPNYLYHLDLGYEYVFDAQDGANGVYLYDYASGTYFYTSPTFPFPYLYDFTLGTVLYYYPDTASPGHYTSNPRYFYNFATKQIITK